MTNALNLQAPVDTLAMEFTREFDAPVQALFRAHAEPELVKQWLGPHGLEMQIDEWDFKTHGGYRYVALERARRFSASTARSTPCERTSSSSRPSNSRARPDMVNIEFMWFEDLGDGRSRLRGRSICPNTDARDALLSSGMEGGMTEGYEKLDALLKSL